MSTGTRDFHGSRLQPKPSRFLDRISADLLKRPEGESGKLAKQEWLARVWVTSPAELCDFAMINSEKDLYNYLDHLIRLLEKAEDGGLEEILCQGLG